MNEPYCLPPIMDDDDAIRQKLLDYKIEAKDFFKREVRLLVQYNGNLRLALYALCFANEWYDLIECETAVEIAVKLFGDPKKKAAVTKAIKHFQDSMGIEPGRGQRSEKGREQMAKARTRQLKGLPQLKPAERQSRKSIAPIDNTDTVKESQDELESLYQSKWGKNYHCNSEQTAELPSFENEVNDIYRDKSNAKTSKLKKP